MMKHRESVWGSTVNLFVVSVVVALLFAAGCRSIDESPSETQLVSSPTIEPLQSAMPTQEVVPEATSASIERTVEMNPTELPPATSTPVPSRGKPPEGTLSILLSDLDWSTCFFDTSNGGFGTAPAPTATIVTTSSSDAAVTPEIRANYLAQASSVADNLLAWSDSFELLWEYDLELGQKAAAVGVLESRLRQLCRATDLLEPPASLEGVHGLLRESLRQRHEWAASSITMLIDTSSIWPGGLSDERIRTHEGVESVHGILSDLKEESGVTNVDVVIDEFDLQFASPPGWMLIGTSNIPIISAPFESQISNLQGFGPESWDLGVAIRIRKLRNSVPLTPEEAVERFAGLSSSLGLEMSRTSDEVFGVDAVVIGVENSESDWIFTVIIAVIDDHTTIVDFGCPSGESEWCGDMGDFVDSFVFGVE